MRRSVIERTTLKKIGRKQSEETKKKRSESIKGEKNPWFGKHPSEELRRHWSKIRKGKKPWNKGLIGITKPWNKGLTSETDERVKKYCFSNKGKKFPKELYPSMGLRITRKNQTLPTKDTSIEVKIQKYLKKLNIEFLTHQYMHIEHGYQCDIFIPVQEGIEKKTIIECFGDYWHKYPLGREIDFLRCKELRRVGYRVLVFWEKEIRPMKLNEFESKLLN